MPIIFRCQNCNQKLSAPSRKAGARINCPSCDSELKIPDPSKSAPAEDEAASERPPAGPAPPPEPESPAGPPPGFEPPLQGEPSFAEADELADLRGDWEPEEGAEPQQPPLEEQTATAGIPPVPEPAPEIDDDEGLTLRKAETEFEEMDLTPMVDVTFLLLIFFMITASFTIQKTLQVPPPDPPEKGVTPNFDMKELERVSINVVIDENNTISVDDEPLGDPAGLVDRIQGLMRSEQKSELMLTADAAALHETFVRVIDAANEANIQTIRIKYTGPAP